MPTPNPQRYRYVHYIATRVLNASELAVQQQIDRLVDGNSVPMAYGLNAIWKTGATLNVTVTTNLLTVSLSPTDPSLPMLVFVRGIWEPFPQFAPLSMGAATDLLLNYVVISQPQPSGDAEMAELQLTISTSDTSRSTPDATNAELEHNSSAILLFHFANNGIALTYLPDDKTYSAAHADNAKSGLVKLTTGSSNGIALSSDDPTTSDQRVPRDNSIRTPKVFPVQATGTNADGSPFVNPNAAGQGGVNADHLIYVAGTQTVESALTSISSNVTGFVATLGAHIGRGLGPGVHPFPNYLQVGATPISHVGTTLDTEHIPSLTNNHNGFTVTRDPTVAPLSTDFAYQLRNLDGSILSGLLHNGDLKTASTAYPLLSVGLTALLGHVSQTSHANPHGLTLGDLGGVSIGQEQQDLANMLAAAKLYTNAMVPGLSISTIVNSPMTYVILRFAPNNANAIEIALGFGVIDNNGQVPLPSSDFSYSSFYAHPSPQSIANQSLTINNLICRMNGSAVEVFGTDNFGHSSSATSSANVLVLAWRLNA